MEDYVNESIEVSEDFNLEKGSKEMSMKIAKCMLKDNLPTETISKYTDLTIEEIQELK